MNTWAYRLPFVKWFSMHPGTIKNDLIAGVIISLVAIPPSLAYTQLSGLPVCYGLYAALISTIVGALIWFIQAAFNWSRCPQALLLRSSVPMPKSVMAAIIMMAVIRLVQGNGVNYPDASRVGAL